MHYVLMLAMVTASFLSGMDVEESVESTDNDTIPGACYFVIHTVDGYTMYRSNQVIVHGQDFYNIRFKGLNNTAVDFKKYLHNGLGSFVSFHDNETDALAIKKHNVPFKHIDLWQKKLDQTAKVFVYQALIKPLLQSIELYDKQNDLIIKLEINKWNSRLSDDDKQHISVYADISKVDYFNYSWKRPPAIQEFILIDSYKKPRLDDSDTVYYDALEDSEKVPDRANQCLIL